MRNKTNMKPGAEAPRSGRMREFARLLRITIIILVLVAAATMVAFNLWLSVLRVDGDGMAPNLKAGEIIVALKENVYSKGDVIVFNYNGFILIKRVIALEGDWVSIDKKGDVYVNSVRVNEPYASNLGAGNCDIEFPYQVPNGQIFVLGDNRLLSVDSRSSQVGTVGYAFIIGKVLFKVWPLF